MRRLRVADADASAHARRAELARDEAKADKKKGRRSLGGVYKRGNTWWVRYTHRGEEKWESSQSDKRGDAVGLLKRRLGEMGLGKAPGRDAERVTLADLRLMLMND